MSTKKTIIALALIALFSLPVAAQTKYPLINYETPGKNGEAIHCTVYTSYMQEYAFDACLSHKDVLKLSDAQVKKITALRDEYTARIIALKAAISKADKELDAIFKSGSHDHKRMTAISQEIQARQDDLHKTYLEIIKQVEAVLTPKQGAMLYDITTGVLIE